MCKPMNSSIVDIICVFTSRPCTIEEINYNWKFLTHSFSPLFVPNSLNAKPQTHISENSKFPRNACLVTFFAIPRTAKWVRQRTSDEMPFALHMTCCSAATPLVLVTKSEEKPWRHTSLRKSAFAIKRRNCIQKRTQLDEFLPSRS